MSATDPSATDPSATDPSATDPGAADPGAEPNANAEPTTVGNYFVSNYPPFSLWSVDAVESAAAVFDRPAPADVPLGLYVHIPFCRKRCDFCYFKVYTDKNAAQIRRYTDGLLSELANYRAKPYFQGRTPDFVYFGGGTPSYLSQNQLAKLFADLQKELPWDGVREVAFECEPGTLQESKVRLLKDLGVTRLSLGVENFDPDLLELNNRAHRAKEIDRSYGWARDAGFDQINIDLIAGMVGETEDNWKRCIERTLELAPDSVTIYQMEVPYNTTIYQNMKDGSVQVAPVADWETKRRWVRECFEALEAGGYTVGSAYTAYKGDHVKFLYRDALWHGADMLGIGVSSFSHIAGAHFQNEHAFEPYLQRVEKGELPIHRSYELNDDERLIREFILQLKLGRVPLAYFRDKFGVDPLQRFAAPLRLHQADGYLSVEGDEVHADREGLLQIDRLLFDFFLEEHRNARYA